MRSITRERDTVFVSTSGATLIMDVDPGADHLYSPDGETFYVIAGGVGHGQYWGGDETKPKIHKESGSFSIPVLDIESSFERDLETLTWRGETFTMTEDVFDRDSVHVVDLPNTRQPEYLCLSDDGRTIIYVSASVYHYSYESFRFFIGSSDTGEMFEIEITNVRRLRDGGTTYIETVEGTFFSPAPKYHPTTKQMQRGTCTWRDDIKLEEVANRREVLDLYTIVEDETGKVTWVVKK